MSSSRSAIALVNDLIGTSFALLPEQYARRAVHIPAHSGRTCSNHHHLTSIDARNSHQHHTHTAIASSPSFRLIIVIVFFIIIITIIIIIVIISPHHHQCFFVSVQITGCSQTASGPREGRRPGAQRRPSIQQFAVHRLGFISGYWCLNVLSQLPSAGTDS